MPRSSALLTPHPVDAQSMAEASAAVRLTVVADDAPEWLLLPLDDGAALQVHAGDELLLTVLRPRLLPVLDEFVRLRPGADTDGLVLPNIWTEAFTPWSAGGLIGVRILQQIAAASGGRAFHDE